MIGNQDNSQKSLFIPGDISDYIPDDHILKRVHKVLDLSWLRDEVVDCYCLDNGRPGIESESALRLMLAGFFHGIVHDRRLLREATVNLAIRWFAGYRLTDPLPHHSSLTRIRQRWGAQRFKVIFQRTVESCLKAGLVDGETVHMDATLIRADVSWESITSSHVEQVIEENREEQRDDGEGPKPPRKRGRPRTRERKPKKRSTTDPDATLTTSKKTYPMEPSYKQHTVADDRAGVILEVEVTTGEESEGARLMDLMEAVQNVTGNKVRIVTADAAYAHPVNYQAAEKQQIEVVIPPQRLHSDPKRIPGFRFKYDALHERLTCPNGKRLEKKKRKANGWEYRSSAKDCHHCSLRSKCFAPSASCRSIVIVDGYEALLRARRKKQQGWDKAWRELYKRHRWRVEGAHGEAKTQHGLRRAVRRGLDNVAIQVFLTAAVMNLKRLAGVVPSMFHLCTCRLGSLLSCLAHYLTQKSGFVGNVNFEIPHS